MRRRVELLTVTREAGGPPAVREAVWKLGPPEALAGQGKEKVSPLSRCETSLTVTSATKR